MSTELDDLLKKYRYTPITMNDAELLKTLKAELGKLFNDMIGGDLGDHRSSIGNQAVDNFKAEHRANIAEEFGL